MPRSGKRGHPGVRATKGSGCSPNRRTERTGVCEDVPAGPLIGCIPRGTKLGASTPKLFSREDGRLKRGTLVIMLHTRRGRYRANIGIQPYCSSLKQRLQTYTPFGKVRRACVCWQQMQDGLYFFINIAWPSSLSTIMILSPGSTDILRRNSSGRTIRPSSSTFLTI